MCICCQQWARPGLSRPWCSCLWPPGHLPQPAQAQGRPLSPATQPRLLSARRPQAPAPGSTEPWCSSLPAGVHAYLGADSGEVSGLCYHKKDQAPCGFLTIVYLVLATNQAGVLQTLVQPLLAPGSHAPAAAAAGNGLPSPLLPLGEQMKTGRGRSLVDVCDQLTVSPITLGEFNWVLNWYLYP